MIQHHNITDRFADITLLITTAVFRGGVPGLYYHLNKYTSYLPIVISSNHNTRAYCTPFHSRLPQRLRKRIIFFSFDQMIQKITTRASLNCCYYHQEILLLPDDARRYYSLLYGPQMKNTSTYYHEYYIRKSDSVQAESDQRLLCNITILCVDDDFREVFSRLAALLYTRTVVDSSKCHQTVPVYSGLPTLNIFRPREFQELHTT